MSHLRRPVVETYPVLMGKRWAGYALLTLLLAAAVATFASYWFSLGDLHRHPLTFGLLTAVLLLGILMYAGRWLALPLMRAPRPMTAQPGLKVAVVTTFVPGAEPIEMLEETVSALVSMDYPHDTWVLDEGDDQAVRDLCGRLGANHFSRKHRAEYQTPSGTFERKSKHGNYNAWLYDVGFDSYDVLTAFDPDHVPYQHFLTRVLGYLADPAVGYVQAPQTYYNQKASFIARGAAEETYAYYSSVQMSSYGLGYPIVTGCHNTHRMSALHEVGGFSPHEADDLLITVLYRAAGWRGVYVPEPLAVGITPVDWQGYLTQQRRWARSVLDVKFRVYPKVARRLPPIERVVSLIHGLYYLHGLASALTVLLFAGMLTTGSAPAVISWRTVPYALVLVGAVQSCELYRQRFFLERHERGLHWRAGLLRVAKWPTVLVALLDALRPRRVPYALTRKAGGAPSDSRLLVVPHAIVVLVLAAAFGLGTRSGGPPDPAVTSAAAVIAVQSLALLVTARRTWPPPYQAGLRVAAAARERPVAPGGSRTPSRQEQGMPSTARTGEVPL